MAESPLEQATRTYEGGPPRAVESTLDLTSSNRTQTRGGYITRRRDRFETMLYFSTRRTSTRWSGVLAKFSKIFQLLLRAPKLEECTSPDARSTMRDSRFQKKIQPADALRLPHGGVTPRAGDSQPTSEVHSGQWNTPST